MGGISVSRAFAEELSDEEKLVIYSLGALDNSPIRSKVKIQKLLFLFSQVFPEWSELLEYEPHLLGPYSENLEYVLDDLFSLGLISKKRGLFSLTNTGFETFKHLKPNESLVKVLEDFKAFLYNVPDNHILTFVYVFYPQYIEESAKWEELKIRRVDIAIYFLKRQKISFSKAVELSGLNSSEFEKELLRRKIRWRDL